MQFNTTIKLLILFTIICSSCKAQQIIAIDDNSTGISNGAYLKDINNDMDKFEGTWMYTSGNTSLTIKLRKITNYFNGDWYEDVLIGEYKYEKNNQAVVDYLYKLDNLNLAPYDYNIIGNTILYPGENPQCTNCSTLEKRLKLFFDDPLPTKKHVESVIVLKYDDNSSIPKLNSTLYFMGPKVGDVNTISVPYGEYNLIKQ